MRLTILAVLIGSSAFVSSAFAIPSVSTAPDVNTSATSLGISGDFRDAVAISETAFAILSGTGSVYILDDELNLVSTISNAATGDGDSDPNRMGITDDGQVYVIGGSGTVKRLGHYTTLDAAAGPIILSHPPADPFYEYYCHSLLISGDYSQGTVIIAFGLVYDFTLNPSPLEFNDLYVYTQNGPGSDSFTLQPTLDLAPRFQYADAIEEVYITEAGDTLYAISLGDGLVRYTGSVGGGWTVENSYFGPVELEFRLAFAIDEDDDYIVGCANTNIGAAHYFDEAFLSTAVAIGSNSTYPSTGVGDNVFCGIDIIPDTDMVIYAGGEEIYLWLGTTDVEDWELLD